MSNKTIIVAEVYTAGSLKGCVAQTHYEGTDKVEANRVEQQLKADKLPNTKIIKTTDIGNLNIK